MSEEKKLVTFRQEKETVELAKEKLEHGEMSERLRQTLAQIAHGADVAEQSRLKDRVQELRRQRRKKDRQIRELQNDRDEIDRDIERIEERLDSLMEQEGEYDGALSMLESELREGNYVFPNKSSVKEAASVGQTTPETVIQDLKERNADVPEAAFELPKVHQPNDWRELDSV